MGIRVTLQFQSYGHWLFYTSTRLAASITIHCGLTFADTRLVVLLWLTFDGTANRGILQLSRECWWLTLACTHQSSRGLVWAQAGLDYGCRNTASCYSTQTTVSYRRAVSSSSKIELAPGSTLIDDDRVIGALSDFGSPMVMAHPAALFQSSTIVAKIWFVVTHSDFISCYYEIWTTTSVIREPQKWCEAPEFKTKIDVP